MIIAGYETMIIASYETIRISIIHKLAVKLLPKEDDLHTNNYYLLTEFAFRTVRY